MTRHVKRDLFVQASFNEQARSIVGGEGETNEDNDDDADDEDESESRLRIAPGSTGEGSPT